MFQGVLSAKNVSMSSLWMFYRVDFMNVSLCFIGMVLYSCSKIRWVISPLAFGASWVC